MIRGRGVRCAPFRREKGKGKREKGEGRREKNDGR
jgi:hypothetical protein